MIKLKTMFRDIKRVKEISEALFSEGMGYYVNEMRLRHHLFLTPKERSMRTAKSRNIPEDLRRTIDKLGVTFIKLGQLLSLRPDLIPKEYCEEFTKLQDDVSPVAFSVVKKTVEEELKIKLNEVFSLFEEKPIASASIGQVHKARLLNGENVVVKVQRPDIKEVIEADIDILYYLADLAKKHIDGVKNYDLNSVIKEFERYTEDELDYLKEARNIDKFHENFANDENVIIPKVFLDYTTPKVLTMSYVNGIKIDDEETLKDRGYSINIISNNLSNCFLKQVFEFGFFHADPHPANVFVCRGNKIALLDYGIIGKLREEHREQLKNILMNLVEKDFDGVLEGFMELGVLESGDEEELKKELQAMIEEYAGTSIQQVNVPKLFREFLSIASKHHFKIPKDLVLLGKSIITVESVGQELDPSFNLSKKLVEYVQKINVEKLGAEHVFKGIKNSFISYKKFFTKFPKQANEIFDKIRRNEIKVEFQHKDLTELEKEIDSGSSRIALSILIAALIVASALILNLTGARFLPMTGFIIAGILTLYLAFSIYKERNLRV